MMRLLWAKIMASQIWSAMGRIQQFHRLRHAVLQAAAGQVIHYGDEDAVAAADPAHVGDIADALQARQQLAFVETLSCCSAFSAPSACGLRGFHTG